MEGVCPIVDCSYRAADHSEVSVFMKQHREPAAFLNDRGNRIDGVAGSPRERKLCEGLSCDDAAALRGDHRQPIEAERNIANKISRGGFTAAFFIQCLSVIGCSSLRLEDA